MLFSWPSLNPDHIGVVGISKWHPLLVESKTPLSPSRNLSHDGTTKENYFLRRKWERVTTNVYLGETLEKTKKKVCEFWKEGVWELFMHREGASTPRARHEVRQPLIVCATKITWLQNYLFSQEWWFFFVFLFFLIDKDVALTPMYPQVQWGNQTYVVLYL